PILPAPSCDRTSIPQSRAPRSGQARSCRGHVEGGMRSAPVEDAAAALAQRERLAHARGGRGRERHEAAETDAVAHRDQPPAVTLERAFVVLHPAALDAREQARAQALEGQALAGLEAELLELAHVRSLAGLGELQVEIVKLEERRLGHSAASRSSAVTMRASSASSSFRRLRWVRVIAIARITRSRWESTLISEVESTSSTSCTATRSDAPHSRPRRARAMTRRGSVTASERAFGTATPFPTALGHQRSRRSSVSWSNSASRTAPAFCATHAISWSTLS